MKVVYSVDILIVSFYLCNSFVLPHPMLWKLKGIYALVVASSLAGTDICVLQIT